MTLSSPPQSRRLPIWSGVLTVLALWLLAIATVDVPLARWSIDDSPLRWLIGTLTVAEAFGHGAGVLLIVITVCVLDEGARRSAPWLLAGALGGGLAANLAKFVVGRLRPRAWLMSQGHETQSAWDTFAGWFPLGAGGSAEQSFPSAHTAAAFGLAVMLSAMYPRGRWWFYFLAALVAVQRVTSHAHFPSDVIAGGLLGWLAATIIARRMVSRVACDALPHDRSASQATRLS